MGINLIINSDEGNELRTFPALLYLRLPTGFIPGHQPIRDGQNRLQPMLVGCTDARDAAERTRTLSPKRLSVQRDSFASGSGNLPLRAIDDAMSWRARSAPLPPPPRGCQRTTRPGCSAVGRFFPSPLPCFPSESFSDSPLQRLVWALRSFRMRESAPFSCVWRYPSNRDVLYERAEGRP